MIVRQDSPRASRPQAILRLCPPSSLDYKARHGSQTRIVLFCRLNIYGSSGTKEVIYFGLMRKRGNLIPTDAFCVSQLYNVLNTFISGALTEQFPVAFAPLKQFSKV